MITLGDRARDAGEWQLAAAYYRKALNRNPQNPLICVQYGHALKESGYLSEAEAAYRMAVAHNPRLADAQLHLGHALKLQGKLIAAESAYLLAFTLDPELSDPLRELRAMGWPEARVAELQRLNGIDVETDNLHDSQNTRVAQSEAQNSGLSRDLVFDTLIGNRRLQKAKAWYRKFGQKVVILIPSYRDTQLLSACLSTLRDTTDERMVRIVIIDDFSEENGHLSFLKSLPPRFDNISVILGEENLGFAGNINRGLSRCGNEDVILVNSDVEVFQQGWLEILQHSMYINGAAIGTPRLLYPSGQIQFGGGMRNSEAPRWFDHSFRSRPGDYLPAISDVYVLYATGALMYLSRHALSVLEQLDANFPMAFEDVDFCLQAWKHGLPTIYVGGTSALHHESATRGREPDERAIRAQDYFWQKHQDFFLRDVHHEITGQPYVIFVCQEVGIGGGHRVIYALANYLSQSGFTVELWNLSSSPRRFELDGSIHVRAFESYHELARALSQKNAIKIATWWETAEPVWLGSITAGIPVYLVQDIESSYYQGIDDVRAAKVLSWYRPEFSYATTADWIKDELRSSFHVNAVKIGIGYDSKRFHQLDDIVRQNRMILVAVCGEHHKTFGYWKEILSEINKHDIKIITFGSEEVSFARDLENVEFHSSPTDAELCRLYNRAGFFLQTSSHEGAGLPALEAMACGCIPIITEAKGNLEYIEDGRNCVVIPPAGGSSAVGKILAAIERDSRARETFEMHGLETARRYDWSMARQRMKRFLDAIVARPEFGLPIRDAGLNHEPTSSK